MKSLDLSGVVNSLDKSALCLSLASTIAENIVKSAKPKTVTAGAR